MALKEAHKPRSQWTGERNWIKVNQTHIDAKAIILDETKKRSSNGWSYCKQTAPVNVVVKFAVLEVMRGPNVRYTTEDESGDTLVINLVTSRGSIKPVEGSPLTSENFTELLSKAVNGGRYKHIRLTVAKTNSDLRTKSKHPIPPTVENIINFDIESKDELVFVNEFESKSYKQPTFKEMINIANELAKDEKSKLSKIIPYNLSPSDFTREVFKIWNRI